MKSLQKYQIQEKENKKGVEGQFDMFNYNLGEIAHEIDTINLTELTPIDALNTLLKIKEKMKQKYFVFSFCYILGKFFELPSI